MFLSSNNKLWLFNQLGHGVVIDLEGEESVINISLNIPVYEIIDIIDDTTFVLLSSLENVSSKSSPGRRYLIKHTLVDGNKLQVDNSTKDQVINKESSKWTTLVIYHIDYFKNFAISNSKEYFAFTTSFSTDTLVAGQLDKEYNLVQSMAAIQRKHRTRALAISDSGVAAVGSAGGAIDLYYDIFDKNRPGMIFPRALKWHIDPAKALSFSLDGNYLLSGGNERVLVFWQLDTGRSQFLPRLNGEISDIVVDPTSELYAIRMADNEIVVFSSLDLISRLQVAGVKAQINNTQTPENSSSSKLKKGNAPTFSSPFYINPRTKHVYVPLSYSALIQAYDTQKDEQVGMLTVAPALQTGKVRVEAHIKDPKVTHVSFTQDGKWMATVDEYNPPTIDRLLSRNDKEINLKFWRFDEGNWTLTTRVSSPHGTNVKITSLVPAGSQYNKSHAFITSSENGGLRLWMPELLDEKEAETKMEEFNSSNDKALIKVGQEYLNLKYSWSVRRDIPGILHNPIHVSSGWSSDGSVIILALGSTMYVVDGETFDVKSTIPNVVDTPILQLHIVGSKLVILSHTRLVVYDLINGAEVWAIGITVPEGDSQNLLAVDTTTGSIALAVNNQAKAKISRVFIFSIDSPIPVHVQQYSTYIVCIRSVPGSSSTFQILNPESRFTTLTPVTVTKSSVAITHSLETEYPSDSFEASISNLYSSANTSHSSSRQFVPDFDSSADVLSLATFDKIFEDAQVGGNTMGELFERVLGVIAHKSL